MCIHCLCAAGSAPCRHIGIAIPNLWHLPCSQDLLEFVSHYHCLLDLINLVTCLYRLAKMSKEASRARSSYLTELQKQPTFQLLLRECIAWVVMSVVLSCY